MLFPQRPTPFKKRSFIKFTCKPKIVKRDSVPCLRVSRGSLHESVRIFETPTYTVTLTGRRVKCLPFHF